MKTPPTSSTLAEVDRNNNSDFSDEDDLPLSTLKDTTEAFSPEKCFMCSIKISMLTWTFLPPQNIQKEL